MDSPFCRIGRACLVALSAAAIQAVLAPQRRQYADEGAGPPERRDRCPRTGIPSRPAEPEADTRLVEVQPPGSPIFRTA